MSDHDWTRNDAAGAAHRESAGGAPASGTDASAGRGVPGKGSQVARILGGVQRQAAAARPVQPAEPATAADAAPAPARPRAFPHDDPFAMHLIGDRGGNAGETAARGVEGRGAPLPFRAEIERASGRDLGGIEAHVGGAAADSCAELGATAYATGNQVAFGSSPDLHTATHEAVHVLQQGAGVQLKGGVGEVGDAYERQADAAGDAIVRGESIAHLIVGGRVNSRKSGPGGRRQEVAPVRAAG